MKNNIDIKRIEFVVTNNCTSKCRHCSAGAVEHSNGSINAEVAVDFVRRVSNRYKVESVMTFGGEPLLYAETVSAIHAVARNCGIEKRQIITNGFFSCDNKDIEKTAELIVASGTNDILLSVDAFHQEHIAIEPVIYFAEQLIKNDVPSLLIHPAWLVDEAHENPYNAETKRLLKIFDDLGIKVSRGNNIFFAGNAKIYLSEYFARPEDKERDSYTDEHKVHQDFISCVSVSSNGDAEPFGNIYEKELII